MTAHCLCLPCRARGVRLRWAESPNSGRFASCCCSWAHQTPPVRRCRRHVPNTSGGRSRNPDSACCMCRRSLARPSRWRRVGRRRPRTSHRSQDAAGRIPSRCCGRPGRWASCWGWSESGARCRLQAGARPSRERRFPRCNWSRRSTRSTIRLTPRRCLHSLWRASSRESRWSPSYSGGRLDNAPCRADTSRSPHRAYMPWLWWCVRRWPRYPWRGGRRERSHPQDPSPYSRKVRRPVSAVRYRVRSGSPDSRARYRRISRASWHKRRGARMPELSMRLCRRQWRPRSRCQDNRARRCSVWCRWSRRSRCWWWPWARWPRSWPWDASSGCRSCRHLPPRSRRPWCRP